MTKSTWVTDDIQMDKPNVARIYDCLLGGYHNFEIDRLAVKKLVEIFPTSASTAHVCRGFLRRVVSFLAGQGIDQFLDIGSGIPTLGNVHEVAQKANPDARIVYVDIDPVAVAHSQAMLKDNPNATAIWGDVGQPDQILDHAEVKNLLDFSRPVALLLLLVLHAIWDNEEAYGAMRTLRDKLAPGSYIAVAHGTYDDTPPEIMERMKKVSASTSIPTRSRTWAQIQRFFDGLELVEPGLVRPPLWRPEGPDDILLDQPKQVFIFGGVGYKP